jgi:hypothetical protein|tara:strand:+ start:334 stop:525 length:192 start_codon:yes stop_codon:yes gene_type:complete
MIKSVAIDVERIDELDRQGESGFFQYVSVEIADEEGNHIEFLWFNEEELKNAAILAEKGCLHA